MIPDVPTLRAELIALARAELRLDPVRDADLLDGDLSAALDSMQRLSLVVAIEDHYHISFSPEDDAEIRTLDAVAQRLHALLTLPPSSEEEGEESVDAS